MQNRPRPSNRPASFLLCSCRAAGRHGSPSELSCPWTVGAIDTRRSASDAVVWHHWDGGGFVLAPGLAALLPACGEDHGDAVSGFALCLLLFGDSLGGPIGACSVHRVGGLTLSVNLG